MKTPTIITLLICGWIACGLAAAGTLNASSRAAMKEADAKMLPGGLQFRSNTIKAQSEAIEIGLLGGPVSLFHAFFSTGYFHDGWTLTRKTTFDLLCDRDPEKWCPSVTIKSGESATFIIANQKDVP